MLKSIIGSGNGSWVGTSSTGVKDKSGRSIFGLYVEERAFIRESNVCYTCTKPNSDAQAYIDYVPH